MAAPRKLRRPSGINESDEAELMLKDGRVMVRRGRQVGWARPSVPSAAMKLR